MTETEIPEEKRSLSTRLLMVGVAVVVILSFAIVWNQANPNDYNLTQETLHAGTANTLISLGKLAGAEEVFTDLLERSRSEANFGTYYFQRGNLRYKLERYEGAIEDYKQVAVHDPDGFIYQSRWNLAQAYARLGDNEQAANELKAFQEEYGEELPQFENRVNMALLLLEE